MPTVPEDAEPNPNHEHAQDLRDRAGALADRVVAICQPMLRHGGADDVLAPQLMKAATSANAMLEEAQAAESDADFISKMCIGLKELREARARLAVFKTRGIGLSTEVVALFKESDELIRIVATIIKKKRLSAGIAVGSTARRTASPKPERVREGG